MKAWRLTAAVTMAAALGACAGSGTTAKSGDDASDEASGGCPDEDPFCNDSGSDDAGSDAGAEVGSESGSSSGTSPFGSAQSSAPTGKEFSLVLAVQRSAPAATEGKDGKPAKSAKPEPGRIRLHPAGLEFNMSSEQIAKLYDRAFDKVYLELYKTTPIGPQTEALDVELSEKKAQLRRSKIEFGNLPTGVDNGPLKGEYSYNNGESMSRLDLDNGIVRNFFFFGDRLWKIYDEHELGAGKPLGSSFDSAVSYVEGKLGVAPKRIDADFSRGRNYATAEWSDGSILLRLVNREPTVGVVFIDESIEKKLPTLRKNRQGNPTAVDATVRDATKPAAPPPGGKK